MPRVINIPDPLWLYPYSPVAKPFPVPEITDICEGHTTRVTLNCALIPYILGALEVWRWEDSFVGTDEQKRIARGLFLDTMGVIAMAARDCGCEDKPPPMRRVDPETGYPQQSNDGGTTWQDTPDSVYANATLAKPLPGGNGDTKRCEAANNVIENMQDLQAKYSAIIGQIDNLEDLAIAIIIEAISILLLGFVAAAIATAVVALIPKVLDIARMLLGTDKATYDGMFTNIVWDAARCIVFCHTPANGEYSQNDWTAIISDLKSQLGDGAQQPGANLASMVDVWGVVGLKNASRLGSGIEGNCDDCDCVGNCNAVDYVSIGTVVAHGINAQNQEYIDVEAVNFGPAFGAAWGEYGVGSPPGKCCYLWATSVISGSITSSEWTDCNGAIHGSPAPETHILSHAVFYNPAATFTVRFIFGNPA